MIVRSVLFYLLHQEDILRQSLNRFDEVILESELPIFGTCSELIKKTRKLALLVERIQ